MPEMFLLRIELEELEREASQLAGTAASLSPDTKDQLQRIEDRIAIVKQMMRQREKRR